MFCFHVCICVPSAQRGQKKVSDNPGTGCYNPRCGCGELKLHPSSVIATSAFNPLSDLSIPFYGFFLYFLIHGFLIWLFSHAGLFI